MNQKAPQITRQQSLSVAPKAKKQPKKIEVSTRPGNTLNF